MAVALSPSPGCHGWPFGEEDGKMDGQSRSQSGPHRHPRGRTAHTAAPAAAREQRPCLETQDFQLCGEELSLCVQLTKITPFLLSYWKEEQGKGQEISQIVLPGAVPRAPCGG